MSFRYVWHDEKNYFHHENENHGINKERDKENWFEAPQVDGEQSNEIPENDVQEIPARRPLPDPQGDDAVLPEDDFRHQAQVCLDQIV